MGVPQSAIDNRVYLWLNDPGQQLLNPTIEHMHREDVMAYHVAELDLSHQNKRTKFAEIPLPTNRRDFQMPTDFANPVLVRLNWNPVINCQQWIAVDIINLDTMPAREGSPYPSICFFGQNNTARLSFIPILPMTIQVYYADMSLPSKLPTSSMPIADIFVGMVSAEIAFRCLSALKAAPAVKAEIKEALLQSLAGWTPIWSKLVNRAPNAGSLHIQGFADQFWYGPATGYWGAR